MTENFLEIKNALNDIKNIQMLFKARYGEESIVDREIAEVLKITKTDHKEIQQYCSISTVADFRKCKDILNKAKMGDLSKIIDEWIQYQKNGTVFECRDAMGKQRARKSINGKVRKTIEYYQCSVCGGLLTTDKSFCEDCGQVISW